MIAQIFFQGKEPYWTEVTKDGILFSRGDPPSDGFGTLTGISIEGFLPISVNPFTKAANTLVTLQVTNYEEIEKIVRDELFAVEFTKYEWLPLLMGKFKTESAQLALKKRLME